METVHRLLAAILETAFPSAPPAIIAHLLAQSELNIAGFGHGLQRLLVIQQSAGIYSPEIWEEESPEQALCTSDPAQLMKALYFYANQLAVLASLTQQQALKVIAVHLWKSAVTGTPPLDFNHPILAREDLLRFLAEFSEKVNPPVTITPCGMFYPIPGTSEPLTMSVN